MSLRALRFTTWRKRRLRMNEMMELRIMQDEARLEYERQEELRRNSPIVFEVTAKDIKWLKECGVEWQPLT